MDVIRRLPAVSSNPDWSPEDGEGLSRENSLDSDVFEIDEDLDYNIPPPTYQEVVTSTRYPLARSRSTGNTDERMSWKLSFVDFTPHFAGSADAVTGRENTLNCKQMNDFDCVVTRANNWLRRNNQLSVCTCETVTWTGTRVTELMETDSVRRTKSVHSSVKNRYMRGLRLWLVPREQSMVTQIGFRQFAPKRRDETVSTLIKRVNKQLKKEPIQGKIITIETVNARTKPRKIFANGTYWTENVSKPRTMAYFIRLFYIVGPTTNEQIGVEDIVPQKRSNGEYDRYNQLVEKGQRWISGHPNIRVTNMQSLTFPVKAGQSFGDTDRCFFQEEVYGKSRNQIQILRVAFVQTTLELSLRVEPPVKITKKTFAPVLRNESYVIGDDSTLNFETFSKTVDRVSSWLDTTNAQILNVETIQIRLLAGGPHSRGPETTVITPSRDPDTKTTHWLTYIRLYLKGDFEEIHRVPSTPFSLTSLPEIGFFHRRQVSRRSDAGENTRSRKKRCLIIVIVLFVLIAAIVATAVYFVLNR